jgi:O-antigen/teichoic acid export membrane protein
LSARGARFAAHELGFSDGEPTAVTKAFSAAATARAVLLITGSSYASLVLGLAASALIARALGPKEFGSYAYVIWISGILMLVANNGLTSTGIRFISESLGKGNRQDAGALQGWLLRCQHLTVMLTALLFVLTAQLTIPRDWGMPTAVFVVAVLLNLATKAYATFEISAAKGHGQFVVDGVSTIVSSGSTLMLALILYLFGAPVVAYIAMLAVSNIVYLAVVWRMTRTRGITAASNPLDAALRARVKAHLIWTIVLTLTAAFGSKASETYLLSKYVGVAEVGFFAIATALAKGGVDMLAVGLNSVLMPLMAHGFGQGGKARVHVILAESVRLFTAGGILLAGVGFMWADVVVSLVYGHQYHEAANVLRVMIVVAGLTLSQSAFGALLTTTDNQKIRAGFAITSVAVSAAAAFLLVPKYGLYGAVLSYAVSSLVIFLAVGIGIVRLLHAKLPWRELSRLLMAGGFAALVCSPLLWFGEGLLLQFLAGLLFALTYPIATLLFRAWSQVDFERLEPLMRRCPKSFGHALDRLVRWNGR